MTMRAVILFVVLILAGCTYMYRDYYEKGCCVNQSIEKPAEQQSNRPYTHP